MAGVCDVPCYHPLEAYQRPDGQIVFSEGKSDGGNRLDLPCGRCVGCRLERSRQWATRIIHEAKCHESNCFVTLTYRPDALPERGSLHYGDFQRFMKRLRKQYGPVRFYMCGEYGEQLDRPHFHACLFGLDFSADRIVHKRSNGFVLYRSPSLERLWPYGFSTVAELNFETAAYTARYVMKKMTGDLAVDHYKRIDEDTGEVYWLEPEFNRMSLKPGIGAPFFERFHSDIYPHDYCVVNGTKTKPPRYYDKRFEKIDGDAFENLKGDRQIEAALKAADNSWDRLAVKETVAKARLNLNSRHKDI